MPTILIAEDYDDNRELLRIVLNTAGYKVHEARNGDECVTSARQHPPDLIMVDLSMPELDGWGVFRELKSDPITAAIPCVAVTAHDDSDRDVFCRVVSTRLSASHSARTSCFQLWNDCS